MCQASLDASFLGWLSGRTIAPPNSRRVEPWSARSCQDLDDLPAIRAASVVEWAWGGWRLSAAWARCSPSCPPSRPGKGYDVKGTLFHHFKGLPVQERHPVHWRALVAALVQGAHLYQPVRNLFRVT
jgi:hypothetical protein